MSNLIASANHIIQQEPAATALPLLLFIYSFIYGAVTAASPDTSTTGETALNQPPAKLKVHLCLLRTKRKKIQINYKMTFHACFPHCLLKEVFAE